MYVNAAAGYIFRVSKGFHRSKQILIKFKIRKVGTDLILEALEAIFVISLHSPLTNVSQN